MYSRVNRNLGARAIIATDTGEPLWYEEYDTGGVVFPLTLPPTSAPPLPGGDVPTVLIPAATPTASTPSTLLSVRPSGFLLAPAPASTVQPVGWADYIPWVAGGLALALLARKRG